VCLCVCVCGGGGWSNLPLIRRDCIDDCELITVLITVFIGKSVDVLMTVLMC
jgi:hypothetical protein